MTMNKTLNRVGVTQLKVSQSFIDRISNQVIQNTFLLNYHTTVAYKRILRSTNTTTNTYFQGLISIFI